MMKGRAAAKGAAHVGRTGRRVQPRRSADDVRYTRSTWIGLERAARLAAAEYQQYERFTLAELEAGLRPRLRGAAA